MINRINRLENSLWENGLNQFLWTFAKFNSRINLLAEKGNNERENTMKVLGMDQLSIFFMVYAIQLFIAIVVFIIELNVHRLNGTMNEDAETAFV